MEKFHDLWSTDTLDLGFEGFLQGMPGLMLVNFARTEELEPVEV